MKKFLVVLFLTLLTSNVYAGGQQTLVTPDGRVLGTASNPLVVTGAGGGVAGSDTQVQFNDGGAMAGDAGLTYNKTTDVLTAGSYATAASSDPYTIYDVSTATDYDYWLGVSSDNDNVADGSDLFAIGHGTTPFSNQDFKLYATGNATFGDGTSTVQTFKFDTSATSCDALWTYASAANTETLLTLSGMCAGADNNGKNFFTISSTAPESFAGTVSKINLYSNFTYPGTTVYSKPLAIVGAIQMTNTSGTQGTVIGVQGGNTRNGAGGTTTTSYGGYFRSATITAGTVTNDYALGIQGKEQYVPVTLTIADNAVGASKAGTTYAPTGSFIEVDCQDADGCSITVSETGVLAGTVVTFLVTSANTVDFADTAGVTEIAGAFTAGQYDVIKLIYSSANTWVEMNRSNN